MSPLPVTSFCILKTVSAVTVHGSTEWCCRELSPKTPMAKLAALTAVTAGKNKSGQRKDGASALVGVSGDSSLRHRAVSARTVPCNTVRIREKGVGGDVLRKHRCFRHIKRCLNPRETRIPDIIIDRNSTESVGRIAEWIIHKLMLMYSG